MASATIVSHSGVNTATAINAARMGDVSALQLLLQLAPELSRWTDEDNATLLHHAAEEGHIQVMELLLSSGTPLNSKRTDGLQSIHCASFNGHHEAVLYLLGKGGEVGAKDAENCTPLYFACDADSFETVEVLLKYKANPNTLTTFDTTPLYACVNHGNTHLMDLLAAHGLAIQHPSNRSAMHAAANHGHIDPLNWLISRGLSVNHTLKDGATPLYLAAQNGQFDAMAILLSAGADPSIPHTSGATAVFVTAMAGHAECLELLADKNADVNTMTNDGRSALFMASKNGHSRSVKALLSAGARVDRRCTEEGLTPLHAAAKKGFFTICKMLIQMGADIYAPSRDGQTPENVTTSTRVKELLQTAPTFANVRLVGEPSIYSVPIDCRTTVVSLRHEIARVVGVPVASVIAIYKVSKQGLSPLQTDSQAKELRGMQLEAVLTDQKPSAVPTVGAPHPSILRDSNWPNLSLNPEEESRFIQSEANKLLLEIQSDPPPPSSESRQLIDTVKALRQEVFNKHSNALSSSASIFSATQTTPGPTPLATHRSAAAYGSKLPDVGHTDPTRQNFNPILDAHKTLLRPAPSTLQPPPISDADRQIVSRHDSPMTSQNPSKSTSGLPPNFSLKSYIPSFSTGPPPPVPADRDDFATPTPPTRIPDHTAAAYLNMMPPAPVQSIVPGPPTKTLEEIQLDLRIEYEKSKERYAMDQVNRLFDRQNLHDRLNDLERTSGAMVMRDAIMIHARDKAQDRTQDLTNIINESDQLTKDPLRAAFGRRDLSAPPPPPSSTAALSISAHAPKAYPSVLRPPTVRISTEPPPQPPRNEKLKSYTLDELLDPGNLDSKFDPTAIPNQFKFVPRSAAADASVAKSGSVPPPPPDVEVEMILADIDNMYANRHVRSAPPATRNVQEAPPVRMTRAPMTTDQLFDGLERVSAQITQDTPLTRDRGRADSSLLDAAFQEYERRKTGPNSSAQVQLLPVNYPSVEPGIFSM